MANKFTMSIQERLEQDARQQKIKEKKAAKGKEPAEAEESAAAVVPEGKPEKSVDSAAKVQDTEVTAIAGDDAAVEVEAEKDPFEGMLMPTDIRTPRRFKGQYYDGPLDDEVSEIVKAAQVVDEDASKPVGMKEIVELMRRRGAEEQESERVRAEAEQAKNNSWRGYIRYGNERIAKNKTFYLDKAVIDAIKAAAKEQGIAESKLVNDILAHILIK